MIYVNLKGLNQIIGIINRKEKYMTIDIPEPSTCVECPCSCIMPFIPDQTVTTYDGLKPYTMVLCRIDGREHTPFDDTCRLHK